MNTTAKTIVAALMLSSVAGAALARGPGDAAGMGPMGGFDFAAVDADKDGKVTQAEVTAARAAEVAAVDADKDGMLSAAEVKALHMVRLEARATAMATAMIERHDSDGDGLLSAAELAARPAPEAMFDRIDADADGAVTEAEIAAARDKMAERGEGRGGKHGRNHGWFGNN